MSASLVRLAVIFVSFYLVSPEMESNAGSFRRDVNRAIKSFKRKDKGIQTFFSGSAGYVVYPNVGKGGFIVGGAHGNGLVFERGKLIGRSSLVQGTIGLQAGGQSYSEIVFFQTGRDLE